MTHKSKKPLAVIFILLLLSLACSFSMPGALWKPSLPPTPDLDSANRVVVDIPENAAPAEVNRVVDGDTIEVILDGQTYKVRYIGVNTPETVKPNAPVEWMGPEASQANKEMVSGQTVYLEKDVSETDRYGRLLRYVYLPDGLFVNAELVRLGYAEVSTFPPDVRYQDLFLQLQQQARAANRGLWSDPSQVSAAPTLTPTLTPTPAFVPLEDILAAEKATKEAESPEAETESKAGICINPVLPNLFKAWNYDSLKCPAGSGVNTWAADQSFEGGYMFWRSDRKKIYVLYNGGKYREFDDTFQDGQPESDPSLSPPPGKQQPIRGFGKVWRENNLQQELGWATGRERGYRAAVQDFEGGVIFWSRIRSKAISLSGGAWGF